MEDRDKIKDMLKDLINHLQNDLEDEQINNLDDVTNIDCIREEMINHPKNYEYSLIEFDLLIKAYF